MKANNVPNTHSVGNDIEDTARVFEILARANIIASTTESLELLREMLDLIIDVCSASTGTMYLLDKEHQELVFQLVRGEKSDEALIGHRIGSDQGIVGAAVQQKQAIVVDDLTHDPRWYGTVGTKTVTLRNTIAFPMLLRGEPIGAIQVFNFRQKPLQLMQMLGNRMSSEYEKAVLLQTSQEYSQRLETLVNLMMQISATLDRDQILNTIIDDAHSLLNAEGTSLFLLDDETNELVLYVSKGVNRIPVPDIRIPADTGVIGHVVKTGEVVRLGDARQDRRHYDGVDRISGVPTRTLLAVPLRTPDIVLGRERGISEARIIGGLEAINKIDGEFTEADAQLLRSLAEQAALILHLSNLYAEADELFLSTIRALVAAIDAKDPYTEGHSQRVSEYSVVIAQELKLPPETVHHVRIGALLHDVGKIGVSDTILTKPGRLTVEEYEEVKKHPLIGAKIIGQVNLLEAVIPALAQHHERMDGKGYPLGLDESNIALIARIVAVADVFDALTSDRPYRPAIDLEMSLDILRKSAGDHLDARCVDAFLNAYIRGKIIPQKGVA